MAKVVLDAVCVLEEDMMTATNAMEQAAKNVRNVMAMAN